MKPFIVIALFFVSTFSSSAGVYGTLEFGDSRETVTRKLQASKLVAATIDNTFFGRTGLNGVFKCKAKLAGLSYHLYFGWSEDGGLKEITLRSSELNMGEYGKGLRRAWGEAETLFSKVYQDPTQKTAFPSQKAFKKHNILISHVWHRGEKQSILMGPGIDKGKCFLAIRYVDQHIVLPPLPDVPIK